MESTLFNIAERFVGIKEIEGAAYNDEILNMLRLDDDWPKDDEVPWCSAFVNYVCWILRYPRSKSLRARSWLNVGEVIDLSEAKVGFDVVILKRGGKNQPGPDVIKAKGHVGFYAGTSDKHVSILGGNQDDMVSVNPYPKSRILGVRRLSIASNEVLKKTFFNDTNTNGYYDSFYNYRVSRDKRLLSEFAYGDPSTTYYNINEPYCDIDLENNITSFNNDAINITADGVKLNFVGSGSITDTSTSKKAHRDGIQIFHKNLGFAAGRIGGIVLKKPKIKAERSKLQCIFASDGIIEDITIQNAELETQGEHGVSLSGLQSGHIHIKKLVGNKALLQFSPLRIGGGNRIWIAQPDDESLYYEVTCLGVSKSKILDNRFVFTGKSKSAKAMTDIFWKTKVKGHKNAKVYKNFPLDAFERAVEAEIDTSLGQTHIAAEAEKLSRRYFVPFKKDNKRVKGQLVLMADDKKIYHYS